MASIFVKNSATVLHFIFN